LETIRQLIESRAIEGAKETDDQVERTSGKKILFIGGAIGIEARSSRFCRNRPKVRQLKGWEAIEDVNETRVHQARPADGSKTITYCAIQSFQPPGPLEVK